MKTQLFALITVISILFAQTSNAQTILRDAEIESYLKEFSQPIFKNAGLDPAAVNIVLVQDQSLNAFVAGGQNIFIFSGLLLATDELGELMGVIAHETGHISGGHLARLSEVSQKAAIQTILTAIVGAAASAAAGSAEGAMGSVIGAQEMGRRYALGNTRAYEASADHAGLDYLERSGFSARGFAKFLDKLAAQEVLPPSQQDEYVRSHPITRSRVDTVENAVAKSRFSDAAWPDDWEEKFDRMRLKTLGYLYPSRSIRDADRTTTSGNYQLALAYYRSGEKEKAMKIMDELIEAEPKNPYFYEQKAQIQFEYGRIDDAIKNYEKSVSLAPDNAMARIALGHAYVESGNKNNLPKAIEQFNRAQPLEPYSAQLYRQRAISYGRMGNEGLAALNLAQEAALLGDKNFAITQARRAQELLKDTDKIGYQQARDLIRQLSR